MAEGEAVKARWPEVVLRRWSHRAPDDIVSYSLHRPGADIPPDPHGREGERYLPASHFTQLVEELEALEAELRKEAESLVTPARRLVTGFANEIRDLIDQHKKEGRS